MKGDWNDNKMMKLLAAHLKDEVSWWINDTVRDKLSRM